VQLAGGVGAVQLKLIELGVVDVTVNPVGAGVAAPQVPPNVVPLPCAEAADEPAPSTASTT
jgi:hypothetical protein